MAGHLAFAKERGVVPHLEEKKERTMQAVQHFFFKRGKSFFFRAEGEHLAVSVTVEEQEPVRLLKEEPSPCQLRLSLQKERQRVVLTEKKITPILPRVQWKYNIKRGRQQTTKKSGGGMGERGTEIGIVILFTEKKRLTHGGKEADR